MPQTAQTTVATIGIDIGKNSFHIIGHDDRGAIVLRQKWSRGQVEARIANTPPWRLVSAHITSAVVCRPCPSQAEGNNDVRVGSLTSFSAYSADVGFAPG